MNEPENIPEDIRAAAARHVGTSPNMTEELDLVARAILAERLRERERCAKIADFGVKWTPALSDNAEFFVRESCSRIAAAIRKEPSNGRE